MADEAGGTSSSAGATTIRRPSRRDDFHVFLNFRGPDGRSTVVDVIYNKLVGAGVRVFCDDESIRHGDVIEGELREAITNSKIYIPIFSSNYASSKSCLRELELIMECWEASQGKKDEKTILPVFYNVHVSTDVKLRSESYTSALKKHKKVGKNVIKQWEIALHKVAQIKGWNVNNYGLVTLANQIVEEVCYKLWRQSDLEKATNGCDEISKEAVDTTGGLPMAINTITPLFKPDIIDEWKGIKKLKEVAHKDVREKLMTVYEQLKYIDQELFLDIACLFINEEVEDAAYFWNAKKRTPQHGLRVLRNWSLIEIVDGSKLCMNDLLRDLGRHLVEAWQVVVIKSSS